MNKVTVSKSNIGFTDEFTNKFLSMTDEDFINSDLVDLFKYLGFISVLKTAENINQESLQKQNDLIMNAIKIKDDQDFYLDLSDFGKSNLHVSFAVKNKYSLSLSTNLRDLLTRYPALFDYVKLDLPNVLPAELNSLIDNQYLIVDTKVVSKVKPTTDDIQALEELK